MTKNKDTVGYNYPMVEYIKDNGEMVFSMGLVNTGIEMVIGRRVRGKMEKISNDL